MLGAAPLSPEWITTSARCREKVTTPEVLTSFHATPATAEASWGWPAVSAEPRRCPRAACARGFCWGSRPRPLAIVSCLAAAAPVLTQTWKWVRCASGDFLEPHAGLVTRLQKLPEEALCVSNNFKRERKSPRTPNVVHTLGNTAWSQADWVWSSGLSLFTVWSMVSDLPLHTLLSLSVNWG